MGMSCNELARATVEEAFKEADLNNDSKLSLEEFVKWYGGSTNNMNISQDIQDATEKAAKKISLAELRRITHLGNTSVHDVFEIFAEATSPDGTISREAFNQCFKVLASSSGFTRPSSSDAAKLRLALSGLYDLFDTDGDGDVSFEELTSGLSILCQGSRDDKSAAAFSLYDQNGDGVISASEMIQYLTSVFKIMFHAEPEAQIEMACTAEELAEATTRHAFEEADKDHDNTLSYSEFRSWYVFFNLTHLYSFNSLGTYISLPI
jgi:Ca2+-binding EF-hand superfamily protein